MLDINIINDITNEEFEVYEDVRHGKNGFRVLRYIPSFDEKEYIWDEHYMFYETINEVYDAIKSGKYREGRNNF